MINFVYPKEIEDDAKRSLEKSYRIIPVSYKYVYTDVGCDRNDV